MTARQKVVVVGGGPVGALAALYSARRGYQVDLYELRDDPTFGDPNARPAIALIPLALSERGIRAIEGAGVPGLIEDVLNHSSPLDKRMIHGGDEDGNPTQIQMPYGPNGQCLHNLPREKIAKRLLLALQKEPNATVIFNQRLVSCDFESKLASFKRVVWKEKSADIEAKLPENMAGNEQASVDTTTARTIRFDFIIGCDGAYCVLRQCMMKQMDMDFQQSYADALWCDFIIPPTSDGDYRLNSKNVHIWPEKESIFMAQPDCDGSLRGGMVAPTDICRSLERHPEEFANFFRTRFPGIIPDLLSAESVTEQFIRHQHISLKSVKCGKFGYKDTAVLLGDSAHTMLPFHAMGMITGLEDVRIFFEEFIDPAHSALADNGHGESRFCPSGVVQRYADYRRPDVQAMTDMAAEHYHELRIGVRSKANRAKKTIESTLQRYAPMLDWATLYSRIQFSHERFSVVRKKDDRQKKIIKSFVLSLSVTGVITTAFAFLSLMLRQT
ncbi:hypothetical protein MMC07_001857 [Pseudocyphellaria aurata]|nr:hypothetical protein [Pseudocyphellaria aurata]